MDTGSGAYATGSGAYATKIRSLCYQDQELMLPDQELMLPSVFLEGPSTLKRTIRNRSIYNNTHVMNVSMGENLSTISKDTNNLDMKVVRW